MTSQQRSLDAVGNILASLNSLTGRLNTMGGNVERSTPARGNALKTLSPNSTSRRKTSRKGPGRQTTGEGAKQPARPPGETPLPRPPAPPALSQRLQGSRGPYLRHSSSTASSQAEEEPRAVQPGNWSVAMDDETQALKVWTHPPPISATHSRHTSTRWKT